MRIHAFLHAATEGVGSIAEWAARRGHALSETRLYTGEIPPGPDAYDLLVIMGGGMNIYQHRDFSWLLPEKQAIGEGIRAGKAVLGICLGAQLIADVLGGKVYQNPRKEIGWFPITMGAKPGPFASFPDCFTAFHWHGDTFEMPPSAELIAGSEACANQAFLYRKRVVGLQFHLEVTPESIGDFLAGGESFLDPAPFVQSKEEILQTPTGYHPKLLDQLLDALARGQ